MGITKCTYGKGGWLKMMMMCGLAQEDSAGIGTENSPWKQHWTMQKVWVFDLVLNGLMPSISYFRRIAVKVITIKKIGKKKSSNALLRFPEDLRWFTVDFPKTDFKLCKRFRAHPKIKKKKLPRKIPAYLLCTSTHFSSFIAQSNVTPSTSWWNDFFLLVSYWFFFWFSRGR